MATGNQWKDSHGKLCAMFDVLNCTVHTWAPSRSTKRAFTSLVTTKIKEKKKTNTPHLLEAVTSHGAELFQEILRGRRDTPCSVFAAQPYPKQASISPDVSTVPGNVYIHYVKYYAPTMLDTICVIIPMWCGRVPWWLLELRRRADGVIAPISCLVPCTCTGTAAYLERVSDWSVYYALKSGPSNSA